MASSETLQKIATRLQLANTDLEILLTKNPTPEFEVIKAEQFRFIADWYHYAILELVSLKEFNSSMPWIAQRLSISEKTAAIAVGRLLSLGLLKSDKKGKIVGLSANATSVVPQGPTAASKEHERQVLEAAKQALEDISIEHRMQSSMTLAIPMSRVPEAKEKIRKFRRELTASLQRPGDRDAVYQLSISFFPLTNTK